MVPRKGVTLSKTLEYRIKSTGGKLDNQDTRFVWLIKLKKLALFVNLEGCIELLPKVSTVDVLLFKYNETTSFFITHVLYVHVKLFSTFPFNALMYNRSFMIKLQLYHYFPMLVKWWNSLKIHVFVVSRYKIEMCITETFQQLLKN